MKHQIHDQTKNESTTNNDTKCWSCKVINPLPGAILVYKHVGSVSNPARDSLYSECSEETKSYCGL